MSIFKVIGEFFSAPIKEFTIKSQERRDIEKVLEISAKRLSKIIRKTINRYDLLYYSVENIDINKPLRLTGYCLKYSPEEEKFLSYDRKKHCFVGMSELSEIDFWDSVGEVLDWINKTNAEIDKALNKRKDIYATVRSQNLKSLITEEVIAKEAMKEFPVENRKVIS